MSSSMYKSFETDKSLEKKGIIIDYGDFRLRVAYAGVSNNKYRQFAEAKFKPVRRGIETGSVSILDQKAIMMEIFAKTIVLDWETRITDAEGNHSWVQGIPPKEGDDLLPFNEENVLATFRALPHLFDDVSQQSESMTNFRALELEEESKN